MVKEHKTHHTIKVVLLALLISSCGNQLSGPNKPKTTLNLTHNEAREVAVDDRINFALINTSEKPRSEVVRISLPVKQSSTGYEPTNWLVIEGKQIPAQIRIVTSYPNGSPRRIILSFQAQVEPQQKLSCQYDPHGVLPFNSSLDESSFSVLKVEKESSYVFSFPSHRISIINDQLILTNNSNGHTLATIKAYGPELVDPQTANTTVIETGAFFKWLRWTQHGSNYSREIDFKVDRLGHIKLTQRILRHLPGNDWTPDFGFKLTAKEAESVHVPQEPVHFLQFNPESTFGEHPELITSLRLANGIILSMANPLALRQNRGTLEAQAESDETAVIRASRVEPIEEDNNKLMIQEGMRRVVEVVLCPVDFEILANCIDQPLVTKVDWRAYDAVYCIGAPLETQNSLLKEIAEHTLCVLQKMSINGDDWGNMTSYDPVTDTATINSMLRFNHCQYVWEDYFRTADPRLRQVALDWSENYRNFSVYWGPRERFFGGGRNGGKNPNLPGLPHGLGTYMERQNNAIDFCTKGFQSFWLTYEETGDPRFKESAEAQAKWSSEYVHSNRGQMRDIGVVTDFIKLYEYTGKPFYLDQAIRLWDEFKSKQCPDLLFTQGGAPATGNDLFIRDDEYGYQNPFYKAYMVQYAINSLPYLLKHRPNDQRLRETILACNNWMTKVQTPDGGWSYPGPTSPGTSWIVEYCHGLILAHEISPNEAYLDAIQRGLSPIVALYERYGNLPFSLIGWEQAQNQSDLLNTYKLGTDRDRLKDFTHGKVQFGAWPEDVVYLQVVLRDYLRYRSETSLLTKSGFVEQILQLPNNLPKNRIKHKKQGIDNQAIHVLTESSKPILSLPEAASIGDANMVKMLIEKGTSVNSKEHSFFKMALQRAAMGGYKNVVDLLLKEGAHVNARDSFLACALHYAVEKGHREVVKLLIDNGADVNIRNNEGLTSLDIAMMHNRREIAELLIASGTNANVPSLYPSGDTPLHYATKAGHKEIIELLIAKGEDVNAKNNDGQTPLDIAVSTNNKKIVELFISRDAEVSSIHTAILMGDMEKVKKFVNAGTDINTKDLEGSTLLERALSTRNFELVKFLLEKGADINLSKDPNWPLLFEAVSQDYKGIAEALINRGADVNARDKSGYTALYYAIWNINKDMVSLLVSRGADINMTPKKDYTPLHYAVWMADVDIVKLLADKGAKFDVKVLDDWTTLRYAAWQGSKDMVELFISKGADISSYYMAAFMGDLSRVKAFIEKGTEIDKKDEAGWTALYWAACSGQTNVAEFLVDKGADISATDGRNRSLLHQAAQTDSAKLAALLISKGAGVNIKDNRGNTPLHSTIHRDVAELLIAKGADVNAKNNPGQTPLHMVCRRGNTEVVEILIDKGADIDAKGRSDQTALHSAAMMDRKDIAALLIAKGADLNSKDVNGQTPLHLSVRQGHRDTAELLINNGADVNAKNKWGRTPLDIAVDRGHTEIVELLRKHGAKE
jgi:ankyrin repeat protein